MTLSCLKCQRPLNRHALPDRTEILPKDGDLTVCCYCGELMLYGGAVLEKPSAKMLEALTPDERRMVAQAQRSALRMRAILK